MKDYIGVRTANNNVLKAELDRVGFGYNTKITLYPPPQRQSEFIWFEIAVDDPLLATVQSIVDKHVVVTWRGTKFDKQDYEKAEWFDLQAISWLGYPKPESKWKELTYDPSNFCARCGSGAKQLNPFRIGSGFPKAKTSSFFTLGWVGSEIFVRNAVRDVFVAMELDTISYLPPIRAGSLLPIDSITQLIIPPSLPEAYIPEHVEHTVCAHCNTWRYSLPLTVQHYEKTAFEGQPDIIKTNDLFGSGKSTRRKTLVSRRIANVIWKNKWKGLRLDPILLS
jgi:hypothetical protein